MASGSDTSFNLSGSSGPAAPGAASTPDSGGSGEGSHGSFTLLNTGVTLPNTGRLALPPVPPAPPVVVGDTLQAPFSIPSSMSLGEVESMECLEVQIGTPPQSAGTSSGTAVNMAGASSGTAVPSRLGARSLTTKFTKRTSAKGTPPPPADREAAATRRKLKEAESQVEALIAETNISRTQILQSEAQLQQANMFGQYSHQEAEMFANRTVFLAEVARQELETRNRQILAATTETEATQAVSYTHLTLPTKRIV